MTTGSILRTIFLTVLTLYVTSCSKDDDHSRDPIGTLTINMMDEEHGKTELGHSDVYIDNAHNFYGPSCLIAQLGTKKGLGNISAPELSGVAPKVAVEPGRAYQVFRSNALRTFPSGKSALHIEADYYNMYVVSEIMQDGVAIGATVKFLRMDLPDYGLPAWNTYIGMLDSDAYDETGEEPVIEIELPTDDFEYEASISSWIRLEHEKRGNKLIVKLPEFSGYDNFGFYIRIGETYTYVYGSIE